MPTSITEDLNRLRWQQHHQKMILNSYHYSTYPKNNERNGLQYLYNETNKVYMRRKQLNKLIRRTEKIHKFICQI
jgi:hypothetical protein